jgi:hypothetical protein
MAKNTLLMCFVLVWMLVACAPTTLPSPSATTGSSPLNSPLDTETTSPDVFVIYHRSGGFAGTDDTWVISADGTVSQQGTTAEAPTQLTEAQMAELTSALRAANFMSLEESYVSENTCCDRYLYEITVTMGGQSKTVRTIDASPTAPAELNQLIDTLNRLVAPAQ